MLTHHHNANAKSEWLILGHSITKSLIVARSEADGRIFLT